MRSCRDFRPRQFFDVHLRLRSREAGSTLMSCAGQTWRTLLDTISHGPDEKLEQSDLACFAWILGLPQGSSPARRDRYGRFSRCYRRRARHRESSAIPSTSHFHRQSSHPRICGNLIREGLQPASHVLDRAELWCLRRVWASARHYPSDRRSGFLSTRMLSPVENLRAGDP